MLVANFVAMACFFLGPGESLPCRRECAIKHIFRTTPHRLCASMSSRPGARHNAPPAHHTAHITHLPTHVLAHVLRDACRHTIGAVSCTCRVLNSHIGPLPELFAMVDPTRKRNAFWAHRDGYDPLFCDRIDWECERCMSITVTVWRKPTLMQQLYGLADFAFQ